MSFSTERWQRLLRAGQITAVHSVHENDRTNRHARSGNRRLPTEDRGIGDDLTDIR